MQTRGDLKPAGPDLVSVNPIHHGAAGRMQRGRSPSTRARVFMVAAVVALACAIPCIAADSPQARFRRLREVIRDGNTHELADLTSNRENIDARDEDGQTPLMLAAQVGGTESVRLLLERGADPNITNKAGVTPLLRAATEPAKVRLLLEHGARPDVPSALGHTPLMLAARSPGATESVRLLLQHGTRVNARSVFGSSALMAAAAADNLDAVRLLVEHGAEVHLEPTPQGPVPDPIWGGLRTPLMWAAFRGNRAMVEYLLGRGADPNHVAFFGTALTQTAWRGHTEIARLLIRRGARINQAEPLSGFTPLHWAAATDAARPEFIRLLIEHGGDPAAPGGQPVDAFLGEIQTPLSLATQRGETEVTKLLRAAIAGDPDAPRPEASRMAPPVMTPASTTPRAIWLAIRSAIEPLQQTAEVSHQNFLRHASKQDCTSCHQQYFPMAAVGAAAALKVPTDTAASRRLTELVLRTHRGTELDAQALFHPEASHDYGYLLLGLRLENSVAPEVTDPLVAHLAAIQHEDGRWSLNLYRAPLQSSDITATALAIHALRHFGWPARSEEFASRIARARQWLKQAQAGTTEEIAYRLLGLAWAGASAPEIAAETSRLLERQREDGGWSQLPGLASDAYATGQCVFALRHAADLDRTHPALVRAGAFLADTQRPDGTWHVARRAFPYQPTMESGFPHGRDSWISATGSSWAVLALCALLDPSSAESLRPTADEPVKRAIVTNPAPDVRRGAPSDPEAADHVDFTREIRPVLERSCASCHSGERARSNFRVTERTALLSPGNMGVPAVIPGRALESPVLHYVTSVDSDLAMPPLKQRDHFPALTHAEIQRLRRWIDQGAEWPEGITVSPPVSTAAR